MTRLISLTLVLLHTALLVVAAPTTDDHFSNSPAFDDSHLPSADILNADFGPSRDLSFFDDQFTLVGQAAVKTSTPTLDAADPSDHDDSSATADLDFMDAAADDADFDKFDQRSLSGMNINLADSAALNGTSARGPSAPFDEDDDEDDDVAHDDDQLDDEFLDGEADHVSEDEASRVEGLSVMPADKQQSVPTVDDDFAAEEDDGEFGEDTTAHDDDDDDDDDDSLDTADRMEEDNDEDMERESDTGDIDENETERDAEQPTAFDMDADTASTETDENEKVVAGLSVAGPAIVVADVELARAHAFINDQRVQGLAAAPEHDTKLDAEEEEGEVDENGVEMDEETIADPVDESDNAVRGMSADEERDEEDDFGYDVDPAVKGLSEQIIEDEIDLADGESADSDHNGVKGMAAQSDDGDVDFESFAEDDPSVKGLASENADEEIEITEAGTEDDLIGDSVRGLASDDGATDETELTDELSGDEPTGDSIKGMASESDASTVEDAEDSDIAHEDETGGENVKGMSTADNEEIAEHDAEYDEDSETGGEFGDDESMDIDEHEITDEDTGPEDENEAMDAAEQEVKGLSVVHDAAKKNEAATDESNTTEDMTSSDDSILDHVVEEDDSTTGEHDAAVKGLATDDANLDDTEEVIADEEADVKGFATGQDAESVERDEGDAGDEAADEFDDEVMNAEQNVKGMAATVHTAGGQTDETEVDGDDEFDEFGDVEDESHDGDDELLADTMRSLEV